MNLVSGFININKEANLSSAAIVSKVKRLTGIPCGHMGTLDPMASGVLPVAVGNAARLFNYMLAKTKVYRAIFQFGVETDTLDATGKIVRKVENVPSTDKLRAILPSMIGEIEQIPPAFSAKNINGTRAYQLARQGKDFVLCAKRVQIDQIDLLDQCATDCYEFRIVCGGGTYIRSIGRDIAYACNSLATMTALVREQSGPFKLNNSVRKQNLTTQNWSQFLISPDSIIDLPALRLEGEDAFRVRNGQKVPKVFADGEYCLYLDNLFYGIAVIKNEIMSTKTKLV